HDFTLEIQSGRKTEILVERSRVAVDATVFATAIGIDAGLEADVRTVVVRDNRAGAIAEKLGARQRIVLRVPIRIRLDMNFLEAVRRVVRSAAMGGGKALSGRGRAWSVSVQSSVFSIQCSKFRVRCLIIYELSFADRKTANRNCTKC